MDEQILPQIQAYQQQAKIEAPKADEAKRVNKKRTASKANLLEPQVLE
jgi:hypothetical protein